LSEEKKKAKAEKTKGIEDRRWALWVERAEKWELGRLEVDVGNTLQTEVILIY